MCCYVYENEEK
jgi:DNA-binding GntR family transcriptional regulator